MMGWAIVIAAVIELAAVDGGALDGVRPSFGAANASIRSYKNSRRRAAAIDHEHAEIEWPFSKEGEGAEETIGRSMGMSE